MAFFLVLTALVQGAENLVQGAENHAVLAIRVEGCGKGLFEHKSEILSLFEELSGEANLTWAHGVCKHPKEHHHGHHFGPHGEHHLHKAEIRAFCANATNATNATNVTGDKKKGCSRCEKCAAHCLEECEGEAAECLARDAFATCHSACLAKNESWDKHGKMGGDKHMGDKHMGDKHMGDKHMGGKFGEKPMGDKHMGGKFDEYGMKHEGDFEGDFGMEHEGDFGMEHEGDFGKKHEGDFHMKPSLAFAASEAAAARLETPEAREVIQARVCELLNKTANSTEPCVVALERHRCDAEGFPVIAVSGIAGAAVVLIAFVAGCRSIRRRRSARVIKNGVIMSANDLETGNADAPSKTRDTDLLSEASTAFSARTTTATTVPGGVGAPTVARSELPMA